MGTQGLITIKDRTQVLVKVVCGCNGANIPALADWIRAQGETDPKKLLEAAGRHDVGCDACLVVQTGRTEVHARNQDTVDGVGELYATTFHMPRFNPRWASGTAPYIRIIRLKHTKKSP